MYRIEFGADGIRGRVDEWPFVKPVAYLMGQALGQYVLRVAEQPVVVIGRDTRPSGSDLVAVISAGLMGQGVHIINLGIITTPGVAYITRVWKYNLGIIVSASHSSFEMNGIKILKQNGLRLQREEEIEIEVLLNDIITRSSSTPLKNAHILGQETNGSSPRRWLAMFSMLTVLRAICRGCATTSLPQGTRHHLRPFHAVPEAAARSQ